jgi:hypothetical protein
MSVGISVRVTKCNPAASEVVEDSTTQQLHKKEKRRFLSRFTMISCQ